MIWPFQIASLDQYVSKDHKVLSRHATRAGQAASEFIRPRLKLDIKPALH